MSSVAILGCGPAGLLAAHAAIMRGHYVRIYSRKVRSQMFGAMYLHRPIPNLTDAAMKFEIDVVKRGTREGYAKKVYGDENAPVSWDKFEDGVVPAWSLVAAYERLWIAYAQLIVDIDISQKTLIPIGLNHDIIYSTIPAPFLCVDPSHIFERQAMWVVHGQLTTNINRMVYNGRPEERWYRWSLIRGYRSWEYTVDPRGKPPGTTISNGFKPIRTDCDCYPGIRRLGRYGKWDKHQLTHHGYEEVYDALQ